MLGKVKGKKLKVKGEDIVDILLENRGLKTKKEREEFFNPRDPEKLALKELKISRSQVEKAIKRIKSAKNNKEKIIVYGDYDADGVCATAIMWEALHYLECDVMPFLPDRFSEGYGLSAETVKKLKIKNQELKIIITVDNGIVANEAVNTANNLGIDVIITDHHQKGKKLPKAHSIIHTTQIGGAGLAWIVAREVRKSFQSNKNLEIRKGLELCAIGTIADQLSLLGPNRSFAKYGLEALNNTERPGLLALFKEAAIDPGNLGTYGVNFVIAPRINAMGRMEHAIDSLRLVCTKSPARASELAHLLSSTNLERQKVVESVVLHARKAASEQTWGGAIVLGHETYHEGVIGLAASKLVEEFYRPAIVFSKGDEISKASARSIPGFNIIEAIRELDHLTEGGGGHPMAAGFSIKSDKLATFIREFEAISKKLLTEDVLKKQLRIDTEIDFNQINDELEEKLQRFEPAGIGNPRPVFMSKRVSILAVRIVGRGSKHLKAQFECDGKIFSAIGFGMGYFLPKLSTEKKVDIAYNIEENIWNGNREIQVKLKDIKIRQGK